MTRSLSLQLGAICLLLVVLCVAAVPLLRAAQRNGRFQERVAQYAAPHARASVIDTRDKGSTAAVSGPRLLLTWLKRLVAFDPAHRESYPIAWWIAAPVTLALAHVLGVLAQPLIGRWSLLALLPLWLLLLRQFYRWCELRRLRTLLEQFPDVLSMLVRAVRIGIPITGGMRSVATDSPEPSGKEFRQVVDQITLGVPLDQALHALADRNPLPEYGFFATALALQSETGGAISDTLERLADVIRRRVGLREHARALASEARTSIAILAALPLFTGGALTVISPAYIETLIYEPQGRTVFASAVGLLALGVLTMRTIVSRSLS